MIGYASRTGTRRNLAGLRAAGWRMLLSPQTPLLPAGFAYGLDNGAWTAFQQKAPWDEAAFMRLLGKFGALADWVVAPDIVAGGTESLALSSEWFVRCSDACPLVLVAVQDGMEPDDLRPFLSMGAGIFIGGSTDWKLATMARWSALAHEYGAWCHVGRVNTVRRIRWCHEVGATSFDGTSPSRYAVTLPKLDRARRQPSLWHHAKESPHA